MTAVSETLLLDSLSALGPLVAGYYGLTGLAGAFYFRGALREGAGAALSKVVVPLIGAAVLGWVAVKNAADLSDPAASSSGTAWLGLGAPFVLMILILAIGLVVAALVGILSPRFVRESRAGATDVIES